MTKPEAQMGEKTSSPRTDLDVSLALNIENVKARENPKVDVFLPDGEASSPKPEGGGHRKRTRLARWGCPTTENAGMRRLSFRRRGFGGEPARRAQQPRVAIPRANELDADRQTVRCF
jgi:hypothetical protein